jgi:transcriptional regulator GlxA family with amidase domain
VHARPLWGDASDPVRVALLALPGASGASIFAAHDDLHAVGRPDMCTRLGPFARAFAVRLVGLEAGPVVLGGGFEVHAEYGIADVVDCDIVYLPAMLWPPEALRDAGPFLFGPALPAWLRDRYRDGATLVSLCTGVMALAETGLLEDATAACYSFMVETFRARFPDVRFDAERPLVLSGDHDRLVTAGDGVYHSDLMLYLIQRFVGRDAMHAFAQLTGKFWAGDARNVYARLAERRGHDDGLVHDAQQWFDDHLDAADPVAGMAARAGVSSRTLTRRFRAATGLTPVHYVQAVRVERARQLLESSGLPVTEIAPRIGYADVGHFNRVFQRETGLTPGAYRRRFRLPPEALARGPTSSRTATI